MLEFISNNYQWLIGLIVGGGLDRFLYKSIRIWLDEKKVLKILRETTGEEKNIIGVLQKT